MAETRLIQSRYRLLDLIGRGGMGEVWRAQDESLGRHVAVKCLKPMGPQHDQSFTRILRERFRREARVAAALQHRGVTVVHDFGEHEGVLYLVMELLDGRNLSQLLEDNKQHPLPVPDVVDIAEQVADALGYTHQQGIVHRDLKPANIMRLADGTVKICDFGIARLGHDIGFTSKLTGTGIAMGTPHYMSPEQISGGDIDHRSDLYSLGCVLYEIATGVPPSTWTTPGPSSSGTATPGPSRCAPTAPTSPASSTGSSSTCWPRPPRNAPPTRATCGGASSGGERANSPRCPATSASPRPSSSRTPPPVRPDFLRGRVT